MLGGFDNYISTRTIYTLDTTVFSPKEYKKQKNKNQFLRMQTYVRCYLFFHQQLLHIHEFAGNAGNVARLRF